jgi:hypothetical protein
MAATRFVADHILGHLPDRGRALLVGHTSPDVMTRVRGRPLAQGHLLDAQPIEQTRHREVVRFVNFLPNHYHLVEEEPTLEEVVEEGERFRKRPDRDPLQQALQ